MKCSELDIYSQCQVTKQFVEFYLFSMWADKTKYWLPLILNVNWLLKYEVFKPTDNQAIKHATIDKPQTTAPTWNAMQIGFEENGVWLTLTNDEIG